MICERGVKLWKCWWENLSHVLNTRKQWLITITHARAHALSRYCPHIHIHFLLVYLFLFFYIKIIQYTFWSHFMLRALRTKHVFFFFCAQHFTNMPENIKRKLWKKLKCRFLPSSLCKQQQQQQHTALLQQQQLLFIFKVNGIWLLGCVCTRKRREHFYVYFFLFFCCKRV